MTDVSGGASGPPGGPPLPPPPPPSTLDIGIPGIVDAVEIGRGGFAVVYRGHRQTYDQSVAVKVLAAALDASSRQRFDSEVRAMGALFGHPHIVGIISAGYTIGDRPYIVMEDMTGGSLADALRARGTYSWQEAAEIGVGLASALEAAHSAHVLHCDVKPENVLYSRYGAPKLGDFGLAALAEGPETRSTAVMVSVAHAAPEVLDGAPRNPGTDVYALASTIMTLILGRPPFARAPGEAPAAIFKRISTDPPPDLRSVGVPDAVCRVLERAMAKTPDQRYATAALFRADLERARQNASAPAGAAAPEDLELTEAWTPPGLGTGSAPDRATPAAPVAGPPAAVSSTPISARQTVPQAVPPARPRRQRNLARPVIAGAAVAVVVIAVILFLLLKPGPTPPHPHAATVSAASIALAANPERLSTALVKTPFAKADVPKTWSASAPLLTNVRFSTGQVAAINYPFNGPASELDIDYIVFANQGDASSGFAGSGPLPASETMVAAFTIAGAGDPTKCAIGTTPSTSTQQAWFYDCLARSGDVMSFMFTTLLTRNDTTGKSLATTMSLSAIRNLAVVAKSASASAPSPPPGSLAPGALFEQLLTAPFDASLLPSVVTTPIVQANDVSVGSNGPFNLEGNQRISLTVTGASSGPFSVGNYADFYIFKTPADAQAWFAETLKPTGSTETGSIDSSGFSQQVQCHTFTLPAGNAAGSLGAAVCYTLWGDMVIDTFCESAAVPAAANEDLAVTLTRMALIDVAEVDAR